MAILHRSVCILALALVLALPSTRSFSATRSATTHASTTRVNLFNKKAIENAPLLVKLPEPNTILDIGKVLSSEKIFELATEKHMLPPVLVRMYEGSPQQLRKALSALYPLDLMVFFLFQLTYKRVLRFTHKIQVFVFGMLSLGTPRKYEDSILGFVEQRNGVLARLMGFNYLAELCTQLLCVLGVRIRADFPTLLSRVSYALFSTQFIDLFAKRFVNIYMPSLSENKRQMYVVNKSSSFLIWLVGVLVACEMIATYMKVPLSSILAFGGVGGLALGLSAKDIAGNFLGGIMLLFNEPFTPGDLVPCIPTITLHLLIFVYIICLLLCTCTHTYTYVCTQDKSLKHYV